MWVWLEVGGSGSWGWWWEVGLGKFLSLERGYAHEELPSYCYEYLTSYVCSILRLIAFDCSCRCRCGSRCGCRCRCRCRCSRSGGGGRWVWGSLGARVVGILRELPVVTILLSWRLYPFASASSFAVGVGVGDDGVGVGDDSCKWCSCKWCSSFFLWV